MRYLRDDMSTDVHKNGYDYLTIHESWIGINVSKSYEYQIDFDRARTCAEVCNWLGQITEKNWCNKQLLGELVLAFGELNGDLRGIN